MEQSNDKPSENDEIKGDERVRILRGNKRKHYRHLCQKNRNTNFKETIVIHNTIIFSKPTNGQTKAASYQKSRIRKSKGGTLKMYKMRKQAEEVGNQLKNDVEREIQSKKEPIVKIEEQQGPVYITNFSAPSISTLPRPPTPKDPKCRFRS